MASGVLDCGCWICFARLVPPRWRPRCLTACLALHLTLLPTPERRVVWRCCGRDPFGLLLLLLYYYFITAGRSLLMVASLPMRYCCAVFASCCLSSADAGSHADVLPPSCMPHVSLRSIAPRCLVAAGCDWVRINSLRSVFIVPRFSYSFKFSLRPFTLSLPTSVCYLY